VAKRFVPNEEPELRKRLRLLMNRLDGFRARVLLRAPERAFDFRVMALKVETMRRLMSFVDYWSKRF